MGDWAHNVYCLNASTGSEKWVYTTEGHVNSSPAIADGIVYVGSWDHSVYAFGTVNGEVTPSGSISAESIYIIVTVIAVIFVIGGAVLLLRKRKH
jgi:outer membrane protein assembly factor BamB